MTLSFIVLTLIIAGSIIAGSYSMYLPFFVTIEQNIQQEQSYYIARAAVERGQVVTEYHQLGVAGSGGFEDETMWGPEEENSIATERNIRKMGRIIDNHNNATTYRKLYPNRLVKIYAGYDNIANPDQYYQDITNLQKYKDNELSVDIIIPDELKNTMGEADSDLCDTCDTNNDGVIDDVIVQWTRKGQEGRGGFTLIPHTSIVEGGREENPHVDYSNDTNIRASSINSRGLPTLLFTNTFNPLAQNNLADGIGEQDIYGSGLSGIQLQTFTDLLIDNSIQYNVIELLMPKAPMRKDGKLYPYLYYKINNEKTIASPTNTIQAYAQTKNTHSTIQVTKSNILTQEKGSFTISTQGHE